MVKLLCLHNANEFQENEDMCTPFRHAINLERQCGDGSYVPVVQKLMKSHLKRSGRCSKLDMLETSMLGSPIVEADDCEKFLRRENFTSAKSMRTKTRLFRTTKMESPLHVAIAQNDLDVVEELLLAGAKTQVTNHDGLTPIKFAMQQDVSDKIVALLKAVGSIKYYRPSEATIKHYRFSTSSESTSTCASEGPCEVNLSTSTESHENMISPSTRRTGSSESTMTVEFCL
jgi:hypothetical protein